MHPEEWRPVVGFEGFYEVSDLGRVRSLDRQAATWFGVRLAKGKVLKQKIQGKTGYPCVRLQVAATGLNSHPCVHQLVADAFLQPKPQGAEVRHIDGGRSNPAVSNLEWGTHKQNMRDQYKHGTRIASEWHPLSVLTAELVQWVRESTQKSPEIARALGCDPKTIYRARGKDSRPTYRALSRKDLPSLLGDRRTSSLS